MSAGLIAFFIFIGSYALAEFIAWRMETSFLKRHPDYYKNGGI